MEDVKLVERLMIQPATPTPRRRLSLSNIDLTLVAYDEAVCFFDPPANQMSFSETSELLRRAISELLVSCDFMAGRLVPSLESSGRLEIDCNSAGFVLVTATTNTTLSQLGELTASRPEFGQLVAFLHEENEDELELKDKPLGLYQLTEFGCGSLSLASKFYHCALDGMAVHEFLMNVASLSRGEGLAIVPVPDRSIFRARSPPQINHPHYEYSNSSETDSSFTLRGTSAVHIDTSQLLHNKVHRIHLSPRYILGLKKAALGGGNLKNCTTFQAVAAKIWKARSLAVGMAEEKISTMLFPVDTRTRIVPPAPPGFSGNALVPGFARTTVKELREEAYSRLVREVQEGIERLDDEYVRSGIDWLEVNGGRPRREDSFSLVTWGRLGFGEEVFAWGRLKCAVPVVVKPGIVFLVPAGPTAEGGLDVFLELEGDQVLEFRRLLAVAEDDGTRSPALLDHHSADK